MIIDYSQYSQNYLVFPLFMSCMFCLLLVYSGNLLKKCIRNRENSLKKILEAVLPFGMSAVMIIFVGIIPLFNGNIYLLIEKEEDAVTLCGVIKSIESVDDPLYGQTAAYEFVIDNTVCTAIYVPTKDFPAETSLKVGDHVEVFYLPRSGYILSIEEIPRTSSTPPF